MKKILLFLLFFIVSCIKTTDPELNIKSVNNQNGDYLYNKLAKCSNCHFNKDLLKPENIYSALRSSKIIEHKAYENLNSNDLFSLISYISKDYNLIQKELNYIPELNKKDLLVYGNYLFDNVARCSYCHSDNFYLSGSKTTPSLISDSLKSSSVSQIKNLISTNSNCSQLPLAINDNDLLSITTYLKDLNK